MTCEKCGAELHIADWPFCPHGPAGGGIARDEIPGGFVQEHFGNEPETFYSWSAMRKRADELGLQPFVRQLEKVREGDYIDPQTMENARVLLSRGSHAVDAGVKCETLKLSVREIKSSEIV